MSVAKLDEKAIQALAEQAAATAVANVLASLTSINAKAGKPAVAPTPERTHMGPMRNRKGNLWEGAVFVKGTTGHLTVRITSADKAQVAAAIKSIKPIVDKIDPLS